LLCREIEGDGPGGDTGSRTARRSHADGRYLREPDEADAARAASSDLGGRLARSPTEPGDEIAEGIVHPLPERAVER
jgi:hypothetical protein